MGIPENVVLLAGDPARQHDWGLLETEGIRLRLPWTIAAETRDERNRWRLSGFAAGAGCRTRQARPSPDLLRRAGRSPTITDNDRQAFTEAVVFANTFDYRDQDMAVIADALRRGRARVAVLASIPVQLAEVAEAADMDESAAAACSRGPSCTSATVSMSSSRSESS